MTADQYAFYAQIIPFFMLSILLSEREMWADNQHVSRSIATCYLLILGLGELIALIGIQWVLPNGMQFVVFASSVVGLIGVSILAFCMRFPKYQIWIKAVNARATAASPQQEARGTAGSQSLNATPVSRWTPQRSLHNPASAPRL